VVVRCAVSKKFMRALEELVASIIALMMQAASTYETSVDFPQPTLLNTPKDK
jgi:hypothetical protein